MKFESPEEMGKKGFDALDPDFEKKYQEVKPILDKYKESGYIEEKLEEARQRKEQDELKIKSIRNSLGLESNKSENESNPFLDENGNELAFSKEGIFNRNFGKKKVENQNDSLEEIDPLEKNVEISFGTEGRRILLSKEEVEKNKAEFEKKKQENIFIDQVFEDANKIAEELKKEEDLLSTIKSDIKRTEEHLAELSDPAYVDRVIDEFADASQAGKELRDEKIRMDKKLLDLKYAERKTVEAIDDLNKKLSS